MEPQTAGYDGEADRTAFRARLDECIRKAGSVNALATQSGISQSTFRYLLDVADPKRSQIYAIAHAAGVSVDWLMSGRTEAAQSDAQRKEQPFSTLPPGMGDAVAGFQSRFLALVERDGGPREFSERYHLDPEQVEGLLGGRLVSVPQLSILASEWDIPIRWLLANEGGTYRLRAGEELSTAREFLYSVNQADDRRLLTGELRSRSLLTVTRPWRGPLLRLLARIYGVLPFGDFEFHELASSVGELSSPGDFAIVDTSSREPDSGYYLFDDLGDGSGFVFMRKIARIEGVACDISLGDGHGPRPLPERTICVGRVAVLVRRFFSRTTV